MHGCMGRFNRRTIVMAKFIIPLKELEYKDFPLVGGKAAVLRILSMQGFNVPPALILTGELYDLIIKKNQELNSIITEIKYCHPDEAGEYLEHIIHCFRCMDLPSELVNLLVNRLPLLHFPHFNNLAVRPSPVFKESTQEIFSGLHVSAMNLDNLRDVMEAIKLVWASMWSMDAYQFRVKNHIPHEDISMALIIQKMAVLEYSGTVLSRDPDDPSLIKINAGWGMPDAITTNQVSFDTVIMKEVRTQEGNATYSLGAEQVAVKKVRQVFQGREKIFKEVSPEKQEVAILPSFEREELAQIARKVEEAFNQPYYLLWGKEHKIVVLDVYPAVKKEESTEEWTEIPNRELYPSVLTHFVFPYLVAADHSSMEMMLKDLGEKNPLESKFNSSMLGRPFISSTVYSFLCRKLDIHESWTKRVLIGESMFPTDKSRQDSDEDFSTGLLDSLKINRWTKKVEKDAGDYAGKITSSLKDVKKLNLSDLKKENLADVATVCVDLRKNVRDKFEVLTLIIFGLSMLKKLNPELDSADVYNMIPVETDIFDVHFLSDMLALVKAANNDPASCEFFRNYFLEEEDDIDALRKSSFSNHLISFVEKYCNVGVYPLDPSFPRFEEQPSVLVGMVALLCNVKNIGEKLEKVESNLKKTDQYSGEIKKGFLDGLIPGRWSDERCLNLLSRSVIAARKHLELDADITTLTRKVLLQLSNHFTGNGMIEQKENIFYLESEEIVKASRAKFTDLKKLIAVREENVSIWEEYEVPTSFLGDRLNLKIPASPQYNAGEPIKCIPLCEGKISGRVKVINTPEDFSSVEPDNIIVVERINFVLAPLHLTGAGVIVEKYNPFLVDTTLCKIIGLPAVAGISEVTNFLEDGDVVEIDGGKGVFICGPREM